MLCTAQCAGAKQTKSFKGSPSEDGTLIKVGFDRNKDKNISLLFTFDMWSCMCYILEDSQIPSKVVLDRSGIYCATSCTDKTLVSNHRNH